MVYIVSIYSGFSFFLGNLQALFVTWTYWLLNLFEFVAVLDICRQSFNECRRCHHRHQSLL